MFNQNIYFRESVSAKSSKNVLAKSPNKHNSLVFNAEPLSYEIIGAIEREEISPFIDELDLVEIFGNLGWDKFDAENIWAFAPAENGPNILVNKTKQTKFSEEIKEYIVQGFRWSAHEGPLCGEPYYGIKISIVDCQLSDNPAQRSIGQIMPVARRACFGAILSAQPCLLQSKDQKNWKKIEGNPLDIDSISRNFVEEIRLRKGMQNKNPPLLEEYSDEE